MKLATDKGCIKIPFKTHEHSKKLLDWYLNGSGVMGKVNEFLLHVTFRKSVKMGAWPPETGNVVLPPLKNAFFSGTNLSVSLLLTAIYVIVEGYSTIRS